MATPTPSSSLTWHLPPSLAALLVVLDHALAKAEWALGKLPGSAVVQRYVRSSYKDDPGRAFLEFVLFVFAVRTLLQSRTRADGQRTRGEDGVHYIRFDEKEIEELVDEWAPDPLVPELSEMERAELDAVPVVAGRNSAKPRLVSSGKTVVNLTSLNFAGLAGDERVERRAIETLRRCGLGSCGPTGFYGTYDVHMDLERDIATFIGTEACIINSQGFATVSSVIPAFCKRGDIIVADRAVNFALQKGIQISRSTVRWYAHNDVESLEEVLKSVEKDMRRKRRGKGTRRFIVTEGIFQRDGALVDLPKLIELKRKYKYRLILDESYSIGAVGKTGRGLTELYDIPDGAASIDILLGSCAIAFCASGGFCAGSRVVVDHLRLNGTSFVFSASMPPLLAVAASGGIGILSEGKVGGLGGADVGVGVAGVVGSERFERLRENVGVARAALEGVEGARIVSHPVSPIIHVTLKGSSYGMAEGANRSLSAPVVGMHLDSSSARTPTKPLKDASSGERFHLEWEEMVLQEVVEECLAGGVMVTKAKRLRGQEKEEARPTLKIAMSAALTKRETEKAVGIVRTALIKVLKRRK